MDHGCRKKKLAKKQKCVKYKASGHPKKHAIICAKPKGPMNAREEKKLSKWFQEYANKFAGQNGKLPPMLKLKLDHSRRVADNSAGIGHDLGFDGEDARAARMLGLLHDIGRFTQFADHQTFRDELSFNHGQRGAHILKKCPALAACSVKDRRRIIAGVRYHNRMHLPKNLDADTMQFVKLARDADKLDIFSVLYHSLKSGELLRSPDIALMVNFKGPVNPAAMEEMKSKQRVYIANVKSLADFFLLQLSWVYDINFTPTCRRMISRKVIEHIAEVLPATKDIKEQIALAKAHLRARLRRR